MTLDIFFVMRVIFFFVFDFSSRFRFSFWIDPEREIHTNACKKKFNNINDTHSTHEPLIAAERV